MTKMTKIVALTSAIDLAKNFAPDNAELMDKLTAMLASEQKRAETPRKKTESKAHKENVAAVSQAVAILSGVTSASAKEIAESWGGDISIPKVCAILRAGVEIGKIVRLEDGRNVLWAVADGAAVADEDEDADEDEGE